MGYGHRCWHMQAIIMERKPSNYHSVPYTLYNDGDYQSTKNSLGQLHVVSLFAMFGQRATHLHLGESETLCNLNLE